MSVENLQNIVDNGMGRVAERGAPGTWLGDGGLGPTRRRERGGGGRERKGGRVQRQSTPGKQAGKAAARHSHHVEGGCHGG
ncbi:hypothetical protein KC19_5G199500 [Ceratodon purpureus]|uniref:Uncharacterized protein n=1 Tax=Ceratodon purpureus TaxID=3225 RepID=A0A8T0I3H7_CERPU|nr:hypothetical protein KC19_5G199500 [Ceratodon purpureus]